MVKLISYMHLWKYMNVYCSDIKTSPSQFEGFCLPVNFFLSRNTGCSFVPLHRHIPQERISASGIPIFNPKTYEMHPTLVFLPGKSHGQRSLMGYSPRHHSQTWLSDQRTPRGIVSHLRNSTQKASNILLEMHILCGFYLCCFLSILPSVKWLLG